MKRIFVCLLFLTAISTYANAQEIPVGEWFAGYSYSRVNPDFLAEGANAHGWHADVVLNTRIFGFGADISKHYGKSAGTNVNTLTFLIDAAAMMERKLIEALVPEVCRILR